MRVSLAVTVSALALVAGGCGGVPQKAASGDPGTTAASLVPPDALALVSVDTDRGSGQRQALEELTSGLPGRARLLGTLSAALAKHGLDYVRDVEPALGPELDLALLPGPGGKNEAIALAQPDDESKLAALAAKFDSGDEHYTVEQVGGWSVVADSTDVFASVKEAQSGRSLAHTTGYLAAQRALPQDALARAYADRAAFTSVPELTKLVGALGAPAWAAATLSADDGALAVHAATAATGTTPTGAAGLLGDVPSGAVAALGFNGSTKLGSALTALVGDMKSALGISPGTPAPLVDGKGVLYVQTNGLLPLVGLELAPQHPQRAMTALQALTSSVRTRTSGMLTLTTVRHGGRVYLADAPAAIAALRSSGPKLVDDQGFRQAAAAADVPARTSFLAFADVTRLGPVLSVIGQALGGKQLGATSPSAKTVVAWGATGGGVNRLGLWARLH